MIDYDALAKALHDPAGIFCFEREDYPLVVEFIAMQQRVDDENTAAREVDDTQVELAIRWMIDNAGAFGFSPQQIVAMRAKKAD